MPAIQLWLLRGANTALGGLLISWMLAHASFAIPVKRLRETKTLLAFHHPQPAYPLHILLMPKRAIHGLPALTPADGDFLVDLFQAVASLVDEYGLEERGYRLVANGGRYQEVAHLHYHLICEE